MQVFHQWVLHEGISFVLHRQTKFENWSHLSWKLRMTIKSIYFTSRVGRHINPYTNKHHTSKSQESNSKSGLNWKDKTRHVQFFLTTLIRYINWAEQVTCAISPHALTCILSRQLTGPSNRCVVSWKCRHSTNSFKMWKSPSNIVGKWAMLMWYFSVPEMYCYLGQALTQTR